MNQISRITKVIIAGSIILLVLLLAFVFLSSLNIEKVPIKPRTIGVLYFRQHIDTLEGLKKGMAELGYSDTNLKYEDILLTPGPNLYGDIDAGVKKLLTDKVDAIWVSMEHQGLEAIKITKEMGNNTPIVFMARFHDPVAFGLVESYKTSGNNSTGVATNMPQNVQKTIQFFKEINPNVKKIGVFGRGFMVPPNYGEAYLAELKKQAPKFGMTVVEYTTDKAPDLTIGNWKEISDKIKPGDIDALFHIAVHFYDPQETAETELAKRLHISLAVPSEDLPTGGTFSYSDDFASSARQAAIMMDKIFKGTLPSDIPVEYGAKQALRLNLKRSQEAGFSFPNSMLYIAEQKITQ